MHKHFDFGYLCHGHITSPKYSKRDGYGTQAVGVLARLPAAAWARFQRDPGYYVTVTVPA